MSIQNPNGLSGGPLSTAAPGVSYLDYPYSASISGSPTTTNSDDHLRDLILQVLFTNPGERVNRPEFGVGIMRFLFEPSSAPLRATMQFVISANLQRSLGDRIDVDRVIASSEPGLEESITIAIDYTVRDSQQQQSLRVQI
jgi:phage baseplate assembly protein W